MASSDSDDTQAPVPSALKILVAGGFGVGKTHLLASLWHATPAEPSLTTAA